MGIGSFSALAWAAVVNPASYRLERWRGSVSADYAGLSAPVLISRVFLRSYLRELLAKAAALMRRPVLEFCAVVAQEADSSRQKTGETVNVGRRAGYFTSQLSDGAIALLKTVTYDEIVASRNAKFMKILCSCA